jgi:RHS repeat-associated protein
MITRADFGRCTYQNDPGTSPENWPAGNVTEWVYYPGTMALQKKKDAANQGAVYEYDPRGWLSKRTSARTQGGGGALFAIYSHNRLGELTGIDYNDATPDVSIIRDNKGRVTGVGDGTGGWTYVYDTYDRLEREICNATNSALIYQRDSAGRRTGYGYWDQTTGAWSTWGGWGYDPSTGRINGVATPEGWIFQFYEVGTNRPNETAFNGIISGRGYDSLGRLTDMGTWLEDFEAADPDLTRTYTYDTAGRRNKMTDEDNDYWEYGYNGRNEVIGGSKKRGTATLPKQQFSYTFDAIGNRTLNGIYPAVTSRQYNSRNQAYSGSNSTSVDILGQADASPTTTLTLNDQPIPNTNRNGMDFAATVSGGSGLKWASVNITEIKQGQPGQPPTATETTGHVFIPMGSATIVYDADGNLTQDDLWNYTWDAENRLIKQETKWQGVNAVAGMPILRLEYKYDAYCRRVEKKVSTWNPTTGFQQTKLTKFAYDDWNLIAEWEAEPVDLGLIRTHHWSLDLSGTLQGAGEVGGLVLTRHHANPSGQTTSFVPAYDGTGNVLALYDTVNGKRVAEYEYGPFGEQLRETGTTASRNPFRWSTHYTDEETGIIYAKRRYYMPAAGRWLNPDPNGLNGGPNLYDYVRNRPIHMIDPFGLADKDCSCCTEKKQQDSLDELKRRYEKIRDTWEGRGFPHLWGGKFSCKNTAVALLTALSPTPPCMECHVEVRRRTRIGFSI